VAGPVWRAAAALAADGVALALAGVGSVARWVWFPAELASVVAFIDHQPRLRRVVEGALGAHRADLAFSLVNAAALGLSRSHTSLVVDGLYQLDALSAARARRASFIAAPPELPTNPAMATAMATATATASPVAEPVAPGRPRPLPDGPVERYADRVALGGLATFAAATVIMGSPRRAAAAALTTVPRPARVGREGFALEFTRLLARRGAHLVDPVALRRLDRVDTIVIDEDVLFSSRRVVGDVVPLADADPNEVVVRAHALFGWSGAPGGGHGGYGGRTGEASGAGYGYGYGAGAGAEEADAGAVVDGWVLGPFDRLALRELRELREHGGGGARGAAVAGGAAGMAGGGADVLALARDGTLMAVVEVEREWAEGAEELLAACRASGCTVFVADGGHGKGGGARGTGGWDGILRDAGGWCGGFQDFQDFQDGGTRNAGGPHGGGAGFGFGFRFGFPVVPGGRRLGTIISELQAERGGVLLVSRQRVALGRADCGVGLTGHDGTPAWGAHILVGNDIAIAAVVVEAVPAVSRVSRRSVRLAQMGTGAGALVAFTGSGSGLAGRSQLLVTGASAVALMEGTWVARELGHRRKPPAVARTPWHVLPARLCLDRLGTAPGGLSTAEAARRRGGADHVQARGSGLVRAFAEELATPLTPVLVGGAALSAATGSVLDAGLVIGVTVMSAFAGAVQRWRADRALARLFALSAVRVRVRRDGEEVELTADALVPGDVVALGPGDVVPADCRLLSAVALDVDESPLTGESIPVTKSVPAVAADIVAERSSMVYEGTTVVAGRGTGVVVATGAATEAGRSIAAAAGPGKPVGVEARLAKIVDLTVPVSLGAAGALLVSGVVRGLPFRDTVGAGVALAVAAVPEGLAFLASAAQLSAARRLSLRGVLVRNPRTIETLGRVDVLGFDKTGTLTKGKIRLRLVSDGSRAAFTPDLGETHRQVVAAGLRATPDPQGGKKLPHPTDRAVAKGAAAVGVERNHGIGSWSPAASLPFEPSRGFHACLALVGTGAGAGSAALLSVKGAPDVVLPRCSARQALYGVVPLDGRGRASLVREHQRLAKQGYRVLAVAERRLDARRAGPSGSGRDGSGRDVAVGSGRRTGAEAGGGAGGDRAPRGGPGGDGGDVVSDDRVEELTFLGFLALSDPVRASAGPSLAQLRDAGVQILMITGDHPATARTIATELEVLNGGRVVTGAELDALDDHALDALLPEVAVVARGTPAHKVRVIEGYQRLGKTVAMTGDGANDAPAIRLADVGIALGKRATPSARAAADVVVADGRLDTILDVLVEGRSMWASVRKALGILVGGNLGEIAFTLLGAATTGRSPLSPRQLLLVNLLTDLAPALAVALRPPQAGAAEELLGEGPERSLGAALNREITVRAVGTAGAATCAWVVARLTGRRRHANTVGLVALVGSQLGQTVLGGGTSRAVVLSSIGAAAVLVGVVQTPGVSQFFGCTPLGPAGWTIAGAGSAAGILMSLAVQPLVGRLMESTPALT
jgi:magnesium-transporting ATPase (P-type)